MKLALLLALMPLLGCGEDERSAARSAGEWSVDRNPRKDNCGLKTRGTVNWTVTDGKRLLLKTAREELVGEESDGVATFRFDDEFVGETCSYTGELTVTLSLADDDASFTGEMKGFLRYSSGRNCGFAALDGPIRCDMDVGVTGRKVGKTQG